MSDSVLNRFTSRVADEALADGATAETIEDLGSFGWLRGLRDRAIMLQLRTKTQILAISYGWIERIELDGTTITISAAGATITIRGRNLNVSTPAGVTLFGGLTRHKIPFIQQTDRSASLYADENAVVIESISW